MITETILTTATTSLIKSIVENMRPKIDGFLKKAKIWSADLLDQHEAHFNEYLMRTYEDFSVINTLVFHNSQRQLKDVYVPQTLVKNFSFSTSSEKFLIDKFPTEMIKNYKKVLITDTAGMGKSTIMKRMFIDLIDTGLEGIGVPIYIELNKLNISHTILSEIQNELNSLSEELDNDLLLHFLQTGGFVFFMDGYDEIPKKDRNMVTQDIKNFITKAGAKNYYIMTSRPEDRLASFSHFQELNIQPLMKTEAYDLLKKYDITENKVISTKLIELLKSGEYNTIDEYLENPLLVSLLYIVFDFRQKIPLKKHLFYRQVYDALFETHEEAQGRNPHEKTSGLDIDDFGRVLRCIGFECLKLGKVSLEKDLILSIIRNAKDFCDNLSFNESSFLDDLLLAVPLFCMDGTEYKWAHKSLMEYFAARFIADDAKEKQDEILKAIYNSSERYKYYNLLDLYYDIDYKGFSKNITLSLCEEFIRFYDDNWVDLDINQNLIKERIGLLFNYYYPYNQRLIEEKYGTNVIDSVITCFYHSELGLTYQLIPRTLKKLYEEYEMGAWATFSYVSISKSKQIIIDGIPTVHHERKPLLCLLYNKKPTLFIAEDSTYSNNKNAIKKTWEYFNTHSSKIDVRTGEGYEWAYCIINELLSCRRTNESTSNLFEVVGLDYNACKKEIESLKKNSNTFNIIDGI